MSTELREKLTVLNRRAERLEIELATNAPKIMIDTEVRLVREAIADLSKFLEKF